MVPPSDRNICSVARPTRILHRMLAEDRRRCWAHTHFGKRCFGLTHTHTHTHTIHICLPMHVIAVVGQNDSVRKDLARPNFPNTIGITPLNVNANTHTHMHTHEAWNWWQANVKKQGCGKDREDRSSEFPLVHVVLSMGLLNHRLYNEAHRHSYHSGQHGIHDITINYLFRTLWLWHHYRVHCYSDS